MNENATGNGSGGGININLADNQYVKELLAILKDNGKDASGLNALLDHVKDMEDFVVQAESKIEVMKTQLNDMKEVQDHPIKTALEKAIKTLETKVAEIKAHISELKTNIVEGCKNAVNAFKEKGAAALDKLASFFNIKRGLQSMGKNIDDSVKLDDKAVAKIEAFSAEYHKTGRHFRNMGRVLTGKPPVNAVKESGRLAKVVSAPYRADKACLIAMKRTVEKMIGALERLEQKTAANRVDKAAEPAEKKPSLSEKLKTNKELIKQLDLEKMKQERVKTPGIEV